MTRHSKPQDDVTEKVASVTRIDQKLALRIDETATLMSVSKATVYRIIAEGKLPAIQIPGGRRVRRADLDAYLENADSWEPAA